MVELTLVIGQRENRIMSAFTFYPMEILGKVYMKVILEKSGSISPKRNKID
jgi:hypothetical protein